jgi:hypothetical protein
MSTGLITKVQKPGYSIILFHFAQSLAPTLQENANKFKLL